MDTVNPEPGVGTAVLRVPLSKVLQVLAGCAAFVLCGAVLINTGSAVVGWLSIAFFGLGGAVSGVRMLQSGMPVLNLSPEGFVIGSTRTARRRPLIPWQAVRGISVRRSGRRQQRVWIDLEPGYPVWRRSRAFTRSIFGGDLMLAFDYGMTADGLAALLVAWRDHWARVGGGHDGSDLPSTP
jgi:hypothetical protein